MDPFALVDAMREALERRDADRLAALLHPDVELHLYSQPGVIAGREAAHAWYRQAFQSRTIFEGDAAPELADALKTVWETDPQQFYEHGYQELVNRGFRIDVAPIGDVSWVEIDNHDDLAKGREIACQY